MGAFDASDTANSPVPQNITKPLRAGFADRPCHVGASAASAEADASSAESADETDLLGLNEIFKKDEAPAARSVTSITEEEVDRIADRVIQKLSTQVIENIAWDVVPDITEKIVREELKKNER